MPASVKRPVSAAANLTGPQARYLLDLFVKERRISARDIERGLTELTQQIHELESRLRALQPDSTHYVRSRPVSSNTGSRRRRANLSPERRAALKLQGHYLALMRQAPKSKRAGFTAMFKKQGVSAAIAALRQSLGK